MKKKLNLILILLIAFFVSINHYRCDDVTVKNSNKNENIGVISAPGANNDKYSTTVGDYQQALKLSVYSSTHTQKATKYLIIRNGVQNNIDFYCATRNYDFSSINTTAANYCSSTKFDYLKIDGVGMFASKSSTYGYWTTYIANAKDVDEVIWDEKNGHKNLFAILNAMGVTISDGDYLIVEPVVTVKCNNKIFTGTINAMMQANVSFLRNSHISGNACGSNVNDDNFVFYYSVIGQSFKTSKAGSCSTVSNAWKKTIGNTTIYPTNEYTNYSGCGYNKYDLSKISLRCNSIGNTYYGLNGTTVDKDTYIRECFKCAERVTASPIERINLYKEEIPENGASSDKYRNLLNFTIKIATKSDKENACGSANKYTINESCLYLGSSDDFNEKNLSKYTYITEINGKIAYCNNKVNLKSDVGTSWTSKSGMAYIDGGEKPSSVASAQITLTCYLYSNNITNVEKNSDPFNDYNYSDIISKITLDGRVLTPKIINSGKTSVSVSNYLDSPYVKYEKVITLEYDSPLTYIDKITGESYLTEEINTLKRYGIYSKFNETVSRKVEYTVSLGSKSNITLNKEESNKCLYTPSTPFVTEKPKLEFRTIDTTNPFVGEDGNGRTVGANWCYEEPDGTWDCSSSNRLIEEVITSKNNSYNYKGDKPIYKIVLTPKIIRKIREYNKEVPLDVHQKCDGNICTNPFFEEIKESIVIGREKLVK